MQFRPVHLLPLCLLASCALFSDRGDVNRPVAEKRVDDSMLQHVAAGDRDDLAASRSAADVAQDAYAAAQADTRQAIERRRLADRELEIAEAELERAEQAVKIAQNGTQEELDRANQGVADARALVAASRSRITLRDRQVDYYKAHEELKLRYSKLSQAKVEASKAHAVKDLDRPQAKSVDVATFERQVRDAEEAVREAEVRVAAARREANLARGEYDQRVEAVPASFRRDWPTEEPIREDENDADERHDRDHKRD